MDKIRNKIITISGEPRSGKSTVVKEIVEKYKQLGFKVHVIETGKLFRERSQMEYLKMYPDRADTNQADIQDDATFAKKRAEIDAAIDGWIAQMGEEINSEERPNDVYIIDSRLAWHNIPSSYAVRLTVDERIAGQRAFKDKSKGKQDSYDTVEEATEKTKQRKIGEIKRYKQRYGVDLTNPENYDLIVDTSYSNTPELASIIIDGEKSYREGKYYPKTWASPVNFLSVQKGRETSSMSIRGNTIESLAESIKSEGYDPIKGTLDIAEEDGVKYVLEGNHRTMAALVAGKTLLPYDVIYKDDKYSRQAAEEVYNDETFERIYDWAEYIEYYGGRLGQIEQLKGLKVNDLFSAEKIFNIREQRMPKSQIVPSEDDR